MPEIKHILIIRLSAMGDVAMTVPVLRAFVDQYPKIKLTVLSKPFFKPFFSDIPNVNFYPIDTKGKHKGFIGLVELFKELRHINIDAVADLHNVLRSKIITRLFRLIGKKTAAVNKGRKEKKALTRAHNKVFMQLTPMMERHANVFKELGFVVDLSKPVFPERKTLSDAVLKITGNKENFKWIGIAPFAQHQSKVYPEDLMQKVITILASYPEYKIILFGGGKNEINQLNEFAGNKRNIIVAAGKLSFQEELQLISNLDVMLSMDSGNAHIAAMSGIKTITLWGATHPYAGFYPFGQSIENALLADRNTYPLLPTSVYGNKIVEGYEDVMRTILPEQVVDKVTGVLQK